MLTIPTFDGGWLAWNCHASVPAEADPGIHVSNAEFNDVSRRTQSPATTNEMI